MNDDFDNSRADREALRKFGTPAVPGEGGLEPHLAKYIRMQEAAPPVSMNFGETPLCRWCWRKLFLRLLKDDAVWDLEYQEYAHTENCDARSDGATLSTLPHEPCGAIGVDIPGLIRNAARVILAGKADIEAAQQRMVAMAELICLSAGVPEENVPWALTAIILEAGRHSETFRQAAWQTGASDWPVKS